MDWYMYQESKYTKYQILYGICLKVIILDIISLYKLVTSQ